MGRGSTPKECRARANAFNFAVTMLRKGEWAEDAFEEEAGLKVADELEEKARHWARKAQPTTNDETRG